MSRRRTFLIVFAVLVIILLGGVTALVVMSRRSAGPEAGPGTETEAEAEAQPTPTLAPRMETVVVVVQPIRRGERIPPDAVEMRKWEVDLLPKDPVRSLQEVVGGYATADLTPPQPLSASKVKTVILEGSDIALAIPPGRVGYSFPIRLFSTVASAIRAGDRVDVLISWKIIQVEQDMQIKGPVALTGGEDCLAGCQPTGQQIPGLVTQYTVQDALVLGVGFFDEETEGIKVTQAGPAAQPTATPTPVPQPQEGEVPTEQQPPQPQVQGPELAQIAVVTLAVDPQSATVLKWALESDSPMDLVLRSASDLEAFAQPESVTLEYMVRRYNILPPSRFPYALENDFQYKLIEKAEQLYTVPSGE
ncbi:MAG TPA: Flp pilus assembly protein CpaB [Anaerolineae bacterium]|nr:Flp pilus assembly protein CpaB [Anaerolineae bacterium]